jgi:Rha family phage regulatory protein
MDNQLMNLGLTERDGKSVVSSRDIARVFEKEHKIVLRDIRGIIAQDPDWGDRYNFVPIFETDSYGREQPVYLMTRDGFALLVMGYTGEKAMAFKKAYIAAFNEMERRLAPRNYKEALLALVAKEEEREALEAQNKVLQITADKYEGQTNAVGLYKIGEIAEEYGVSAQKINRFLEACRVQYLPGGTAPWRLYSDYLPMNLAEARLTPTRSGRDVPLLMWTAKGRDFIADLVEREMPSWYA